MTNLEIAVFVIEFSIIAALVIVLKKRGPNHKKSVFDLFGTPGIVLSIALFAVWAGKIALWYHGYL
ncbi:hypothetical protein [Rhizobium sp.]|uniref:hypothetical protein n=1 Tax=Rhizobium sp. TaxID=391 RepID=UPI0028AFD47F